MKELTDSKEAQLKGKVHPTFPRQIARAYFLVLALFFTFHFHVPGSAQGPMCLGCDCAYVCGRISTWSVCASRYEEAHPTTMSSTTVRQAKWEEEKEKGEEVKGGLGQEQLQGKVVQEAREVVRKDMRTRPAPAHRCSCTG